MTRPYAPGHRIPPELLLKAYASGVFPMAESASDPEVFWVRPETRGVIPLDRFHVPRSLRKLIRKNPFDIRFDKIAVSNDAPEPPAYPGAEANAPWRAEAAARIEAHRKANLGVNVVDLSGAPVPGATVHVAMQQHVRVE